MMTKRQISQAAVLAIVLVIVVGSTMLHLHTKRERSRRISCVGNLVNIGLGLKMYAGDHGDDYRYPDSLAAVSPYIAGQVKLFICPSHSSHACSMQEVESWGDYLYFNGFSEHSPPDSIIMMCRPGNHGDKGVNVLFGDGHCQWIETGDLIERLARRQQRSNGIGMPLAGHRSHTTDHTDRVISGSYSAKAS